MASSEARLCLRALPIVFATAFCASACEPTQAPRAACVIEGAVVPEAAFEVRPAPSLAALQRRLGETKPPAATWIAPAGPGTANFVERGEFVGVAVSNRPAQRYRFVAAVLVDMRPVPARWTMKTATGKHEASDVAGVFREITDRAVEFRFEVDVPDDGRAHEVATFVELAPAGTTDGGDADVRRWVVGQPGQALAAVNCETVRPTPFSEEELALRRSGVTSSLARLSDRQLHAAVEFHPGTSGVAALIDGAPQPATAIYRADGSEHADVLARRTWPTPERAFHHAIVAVWHDIGRTDEGAQWTSNFATTNVIVPEVPRD